MGAADLTQWLALALDGESVNNGNTGLEVILLVSIVSGWVLLGALWYFVFSARAQSRRENNEDPRD